jgi:WD40 repeat protein
MSFTLDGQPITAEALAQPVELKPGEHELVVFRGGKKVKRVLFTVTGGRNPSVEYREPDEPDGTDAPGSPKAADPEAGFVSIFNGKDLTGWDAPSRPESFGVDPDGLLTVKGDTPAGGVHWLYTKQQYTDYVLRLEFKFALPNPTGTAAAVAPRAALEKGATGARSQRVRVPLRNHGDAPRTGAVMYTINDAVEPKQPLGELATGTWHALELEVRGPNVRVTINGKPVNDVDLTKIDRTLLAKTERWAEAELDRRKGHIGLMSWRNPVKLRNIRVKDLSADPKGGPAMEPPVTGNPLLRRWVGHTRRASGVWFFPDGKTVLSSQIAGARFDPTMGCSVFSWATDSDKPLPGDLAPRRRENHDRGIVRAAFSRDGRFALYGCVDVTDTVLGHFGRPTLVYVERATGTLLKDIDLSDREIMVTGADLSADGKFALVCPGDGTARVFSTSDWKETRRAEGEFGCFDPTGKWFLTAKGNDLLLWPTVGDGPEARRLKGAQPVSNVCWSPAGRVALACGPKGATVWDTETGTEGVTFTGHTGPVACGAFAPDGKRVVTGSEDKTARLWDATTGKELFRYEDHEAAVTGVAFSPGGGRLATSSLDTRVRLWAVPTAKGP